MHPKHKNTVVPNDDEPTFKEVVAWYEAELIRDALRQKGGNIRQARILLNMPRASMVLKMKRLDIDADEYK